MHLWILACHLILEQFTANNEPRAMVRLDDRMDVKLLWTR